MLSDVFSYIRGRFYSVAYYFSYIGNWLDAQGSPWKYLSPPFYSIRDLCTTIGGYFYDAYLFTKTIEDVLDDAWTKAKQVFNYVYDVLADKVNDALNAAGTAWDKAVDAWHLADDVWDYATGWLRDKAVDAWHRAGNVWDTVTDWLKETAVDAYNKAVWAYEQIAAAVTTATQDIYAWVKAIPAEISDYIAGVVTAIGAVTIDIVQTLINAALAAVAGPINLINLWFDSIQDFFNDPLGWLESKFTDWFLGPEK